MRAWRLFFEPRDLWVGAYWSPSAWPPPRGTLYVCPLPTLGVAITFGPPVCWCGRHRDDGRHEPVADCSTYQSLDGTMGCPDPGQHHPYRVAPLWRRHRDEVLP